MFLLLLLLLHFCAISCNFQHTVEQYHSSFRFSDILSNWDLQTVIGVADVDSKGPRCDTTVTHSSTWKLSAVLQSNTSPVWSCAYNTKVCKCATCQDGKLTSTSHCCRSAVDARRLKAYKEPSQVSRP